MGFQDRELGIAFANISTPNGIRNQPQQADHSIEGGSIIISPRRKGKFALRRRRRCFTRFRTRPENRSGCKAVLNTGRAYYSKGCCLSFFTGLTSPDSCIATTSRKSKLMASSSTLEAAS